MVGLFATLWVLLPTLFHGGYRVDPLELQCIASEWVWATRKQPMLPAWILELINLFTCRSFAAPFIAAQLCTILALWSVWKLGRTVLEERLALLGAFSVLPYVFFTSQSTMYNQNNVLIAFWCLSVYLCFQAFQTNQKRYWMSAGIALGLAFHAKYSAVFLVVSILAYMLVRKDGRRYFRTQGPYLTTLMAFLVFLPHLVWLFHHDFAPLAYASGTRRPALLQWHQRIFGPSYFAVTQLRFCIPFLFILIPAVGFVWNWKIRRNEQNKVSECEKFLFYCFMIPLVCHVLYSGIRGYRLSTEFGAPFWVFGGLWLLLRFQVKQEIFQTFRWGVLLTIVAGLFNIVGFIATLPTEKQSRLTYYPMQELGGECDRRWNSRFDTPCPYISGQWYLAGSAAYAMKDRPSVHFYYYGIEDLDALPTGTWATDEDVNQTGGILLWEVPFEQTTPDWVHHRFPRAEILPEMLELPYKSGAKIPPLKIRIAVIPPKL